MPPLARRANHRPLRWWRVVAAVAAVVVLAGVTGGVLVYRQLNGNIRSVDISSVKQPGASAAAPDDDPFAGRALNILVIGSDTRSGRTNCSVGGACSDSGINADVEMLVHVSKDRSNAGVVSIPRDTMTSLPACTDPDTERSVGVRYGQINSSLAYGAACTVASVEKLTGLSIDHFVMVDFAGVITMSDAVGGAEVCVDNSVYDPDSGLKLSKGTHTLVGRAALEFLRTRHGFGDGSDLGRTSTQHLYISALIRKLKSAGVLLNPVSVYQVAQAATKALTVDTDLASIGRLVKLAGVLNAVPSERITFVTMQTAADPANPNRVVMASSARKLFAAIRRDRSLSEPEASATPSPTPGASSSPSPTPGTTPGASKSALEGAHATTADDANTCAKVATGYVISYRWRRMTPQQAYADSPTVKDSDAA
ncbi:LCP family protein [Spongisporangium articulatum]|uniref:LCP family protein n=1 Tax=Spongisporangium articulatum TaxID=3362603 RepID=A0ABW8AL36_9ACTN